MAFKVHPITKYNYSFDARAGGPGSIQMWNGASLVTEARFVEESAAVPAPTFTADLNSAKVFFRKSAQPGLIDLLRNESPVSVTINNQPPGFVFVHSGVEAVGEGDG